MLATKRVMTERWKPECGKERKSKSENCSTHSAFSPFNYLIRSISPISLTCATDRCVAVETCCWTSTQTSIAYDDENKNEETTNTFSRRWNEMNQGSERSPGTFFHSSFILAVSVIWKSQCVSISNVCLLVRVHVRPCRECIYFCTKFQLLNECNGILFSMCALLSSSLWVFSCESNRLNGFGPVGLWSCFARSSLESFFSLCVRVCYHHTHSLIRRVYHTFATIRVSFEANAKESVPFSRFSTTSIKSSSSSSSSHCLGSLFRFPLNFFVFNSLKVKCVRVCVSE